MLIWCTNTCFKPSNTFFCVCLPNLHNFNTFGYFEHSLFRTKSLVPFVFEITLNKVLVLNIVLPSAQRVAFCFWGNCKSDISPNQKKKLKQRKDSLCKPSWDQESIIPEVPEFFAVRWEHFVVSSITVSSIVSQPYIVTTIQEKRVRQWDPSWGS